MEFLKKNYMKLIMSVILLAGAVLYIILITQYKASYHNLDNPLKTVDDPNMGNSALFGYLAALSFFLFGFAFIVLKMFTETKKYGKYVLLGGAALATAFMIVSIVMGVTSHSIALSLDIMHGNYDQTIVNGAALASGQDALIDVPLSQWPADNAALAPMIAILKSTIQSTKDLASYQFFDGVVVYVMQLFVFGLLPLLYAVKKMVCKHEAHAEKAETAPAKAAAKK